MGPDIADRSRDRHNTLVSLRMVQCRHASARPAQVIIKNLQNMHERSLLPTGVRRRMELEYQDWARLQGSGRHSGGPCDRLVPL